VGQADSVHVTGSCSLLQQNPASIQIFVPATA
jgi:hypothetical protein